MGTARLISIVALTIILCACDAVTVKHPIGAPIVEDLSPELDGVWQGGEENTVFYVKYKSNGVLQLAHVGWRHDKFVFRDTTCLLTTLAGQSFINFSAATPSNGDAYFFAMYTLAGDDYLLLYYPKTGVFKEAIKNGQLHGKMTARYSDNLSIAEIDDGKEKVDNFIKNHKTQEIFDFSRIDVLKRISSKLPRDTF